MWKDEAGFIGRHWRFVRMRKELSGMHRWRAVGSLLGGEGAGAGMRWTTLGDRLWCTLGREIMIEIALGVA